MLLLPRGFRSISRPTSPGSNVQAQVGCRTQGAQEHNRSKDNAQLPTHRSDQSSCDLNTMDPVHDTLGLLDDSASEYVAERLAKTDFGLESESDVGVVGEGSAGAGPGGAARPGEPGAHPLTSPHTPRQQAESSTSAEADSLETLLSRAGFITQLGPYSFSIPKGG